MKLRSAALLFLCTIGCGARQPIEAKLTHAVEEFSAPGTYAVGYSTRELIYDEPATGELGRKIRVHFWYPAKATQNEKAVYSMGPSFVESPRARIEAPVDTSGPFPVIIYSHGSGADAEFGYPYTEYLASHGYIVVAPSHEGNTDLDGVFPWEEEMTFLKYHRLRPADIHAVIGAIDSQSFEPTSGDVRVERPEHLSMKDIILFGYSYGGYAVFAATIGGLNIDGIRYEVCEFLEEDCTRLAISTYVDRLQKGFQDERIRAIIAQAPAFVASFPEESLGNLGVPTLFMTGRADKIIHYKNSSTKYWRRLGHHDDVWLDVPRANHQSFITTCSDFPMWAQDAYLPGGINLSCPPHLIPSENLIPIFNGTIRRFAESVLKKSQFRIEDFPLPEKSMFIHRHGRSGQAKE